MREMGEDILEFLSTTVEVIVNLHWEFLIKVLFGSEEGIGIRVKLTSLSLSQVDGDDIIIINGHQGCRVGLWVEPREEGGTIVSHGVLIGGDVEAKSGQEGRRELMNSYVSLVCLIARRARGTRGAKIVVADVGIRCRHMAGAVCDLVKVVDCFCSGGDPNAVGKRYGSLRLRKGGRAIVGLTGDVRRAARVDDSGAGGDDDRVVRKRGGEYEGGGGSLVGVRVYMALLPCVLFSLASGGALATVCLLLLLLASLLLLRQPVPPLLLLPLLLLLWWSLLLLLELGVPRVVLYGANLVCVVMQLFLPQLMLLPSNERHSLNIGESGKGVFLFLLLLALYRGGHYLGGRTHIEYLSEDIHVPQ